jgi:hypothetical protein
MRRWPAVQKRAEEQRTKLKNTIPKDDPIRSTIDLLSPLGCLSDEIVHTQVISYLLDPSKTHAHGFERSVLRRVLEQVKRAAANSDGGVVASLGRVLELLALQRAKVIVRPEFRYRIDGFRDRSLARCDIRVDVSNGKRSALIIIENKIGAPESKGQLGWYEKLEREWRKEHWSTGQEPVSLLLFLTRDGRPPTSAKESVWAKMSYLQLAAALRQVWSDFPNARGRHWLGFYISSLMSGVSGIQFEHLKDVPMEDIETYLGTRMASNRSGAQRRLGARK